MPIADWARGLAASPELSELFQDLDGPREWREIALEARPVLLAAAYQRQPRKTLLVTSTYERALQWQAKLGLCGISEAHVRQLPSGLSALFEDAAPETNAISDRIGALRFLVEEGPGIVIATPQAALERTLPAEVLDAAFLQIRPGDHVSPESIQRSLTALGYEYGEPVRIPGQFSQRGGIVDIFPMGRPLPIRVELFGDEVESLRQFDPASQRSVGPVPMLMLAPSRETLYPLEPTGFSMGEELLRSMEIEAAALPEEAAVRLEELIKADARSLDERIFFDRLDLYRPLLHPDSGCAVNLLPDDGWLVLDEPVELGIIAERSDGELAQALEARCKRGEILHSVVGDFALAPEHLGSFDRTLALNFMGATPDWLPYGTVSHSAEAASLESHRGRPEAFAQTLKNWLESGFSVMLGTDQPTRAKAVLAQVDLHPLEGAEEGPALYLSNGNLAGGFVMPHAKLALVTDQELFGVGRLKLPQKRFNEGAPIATVLDLKPGDFVVHINFGIGMFQGLTKRTVDGVEKEYLYIQYAAPDKLFVPADQLDRVQKYLNPGDVAPKLNRLTGGDWQRTVGKAREEAREFARDLIKLYAQRKKAQRVGLGPDSPWQAEMEATFPWVETPSQMMAIREAKKDLTVEYPMDRLVCGDVGFGKTEVAIRAAFKVAQAGKQVAVLCPTTILSEQHFRNFVDRLGAFPVRIELLNRFRSTAERNRIVKELESGAVDIIIGTHALLGKDLKFKELGLVIIDEEQKFGVKQKEALKALRVSVDILTLSATPIPRTLSMALMDIRQMSLINDPPPGRLPIRTFLRPHSDDVVREAILREMARGGQVYYVYNRVQGIHHIEQRLKKLVPSARIGVGHGQMSEEQLEPVMIGFIKGELDVLLSTTIIENGLDIPNANTLIVDNADRLGLAQLYQLRGRVGRSDRQAYAYLLYQKDRELTEGALQRLQSLQEFTSLGSGYSLAFRDLQIRGAGELLGAKQHGAMANVGYELYTQLIQEEVQFLKSHADGEKPNYKDPLEGLEPLPTIDLPISAFLPSDYIPDQAQRLFSYKSIMATRSIEELREAFSDVEDRYGKPPAEVQRVEAVMRLRIKARDLGISKIDGKGGRLAATLNENSALPPRVFSNLGRKNRECYLTRGVLIWPFTGDPLAACETMLKTLEDTIEEMEEQRRSLGVEA